MKNKSLINSMVHQHCPGCRSEKMFTDSIFSWRWSHMHRKCPECGQVLEPEPGFYTGAMYVSYAFQVAIVITVFVASRLFVKDASMVWYISWIVGLVVGLSPLIYRLSRSIWAHIFIPFKGLNDPKETQEKPAIELN